MLENKILSFVYLGTIRDLFVGPFSFYNANASEKVKNIEIIDTSVSISSVFSLTK